LPPVQPIQADLQYGLSFDTFDDTVRYDNGEVAWWFGGLHNFYLITRFTAPADFALQRVIIALLDSNTTTPVNLWLKEDVLGAPGQVLWSGSLLYDSPQTWLGTTIDEGYAYSFAAGESFWLELFSPGPPYECYDESQLQPPRSFTNFSSPSPGDNFIRAVGEYTSALVDVGLDSVWHGGLFFVPDSGSIVLEASAHNYGSLPAQFTVSCSLFSAIWEPEDLIGSQNLSLAAGDSLMISFEPYDCAIEGSHIFRFRTELAGDTNVYNNVMEIETQLYHIPPIAELRYDDGIRMGMVVTPILGDGWGMRFDPNQSGYYRVESVNVSVDTTSGMLPALVQVLAENPVNLSPGAVLWDTIQVLDNGWNELPVGLTTSGAFYVAYLFENGNSSPALNYDHFPLSGECWSKMSGVWVKGECLEEWMLRAVIDTSGASGPPPGWVTSSHSFIPGWNILSLPLIPQWSSVDSIFGDDIIGPYFLYDYSPSTGYRLVEEVMHGLAYWLALQNSATVDLSGLIDADTTRINLSSGWNLVGCALTVPVQRDSLHFSNGVTNVNFVQAVNAQWIAPAVYAFLNPQGSYALTNTLTPWGGYWLQALVPGLQMITNPPGAGISLPAQAQNPGDDENDWFVPISLAQGQLSDHLAGFGEHLNATNGYDPWYDLPAPPIPPSGEYVRLVYYRPEWLAPVGEVFCQDVRAPLNSAETVVWEGRVEASQTGLVTIDFDSIAQILPQGYGAMAELGGQVINLIQTPSFSFNYAQAETIWITVSNELPAIQDLAFSIVGADAVLDWGDVQAAQIYHVYRSSEPYFGVSGLVPIGNPTRSQYTDPNILANSPFFYRVTWE
jgi:hypothetical protein